MGFPAEKLNKNFSEIEKKKAFFKKGKPLDLDFRLKALNLLLKSVQHHEDKILKALLRDLGRPAKEVFESELIPIYKNLNQVIDHLKQWSRTKKDIGPTVFPLSHIEKMLSPYGVTLIITPYNFPFASTINTLASSIAAGNCSLVRPSQAVKHSKAILKTLTNDIFSSDYIEVVDFNHKQIEDAMGSGVDFLFFMGSLEIGRKLETLATHHGVKTAFHLSGKNPVLIDKENSSYLEQAVRRTLWGKFLNTGQSCTAPDYCLVPSEDKKRFIHLCRQIIKEFYGPNPSLSHDFGRMNCPESVKRLADLIKDTEVLVGGDYNIDQNFFSPTIVSKVSENMPIAKEEIFGPVMVIHPYDDIEQAYEIIEKCPQKPLAAYLFSCRPSLVETFKRRISATEICINDVMIQNTYTKGLSGGCGKFGFETFTQKQLVLTNTLKFDVPLRFPPHKSWAVPLIQRLLPWV